MYIRSLGLKGDGQDFDGREMLPGLYFRHPDGTVRGYPVGLQGTPWLKLDDCSQGNLHVYTEQFLTGITFQSSEASQAQETRPLASRDEVTDPDRWQIATSTHWSRGDASLVEGFTAWLNRQRPNNYPSTRWAGRQSVGDSLKALSALRLRHYYNIEDGMKRTRDASGKPLYTDRSSWDRAQRRAVHIFNKTYPAQETQNRKAKSATGWNKTQLCRNKILFGTVLAVFVVYAATTARIRPQWTPQQWSDVPAGTPLFHTQLAFENYPVALDIGDLTQDGPSYAICAPAKGTTIPWPWLERFTTVA